MDNYEQLFNTISEVYALGKTQSFKSVNIILLKTYWHIGQHIVTFEQGGSTKALYGDKILDRLSKDLSLQFGKGFSLSNIKRFRQFYITYPNGVEALPLLQRNHNQENPIGAEAPHLFQGDDNQLNTIGAEAPHQLSWSHYIELMKIEDPLERSFYEKQSLYENWSTTELIRQKKASLFLRLALGKDKKEIIKLSEKGKIITQPEDIIKDTYVLEFLKIAEPYQISETDLETRLINQLQEFLLELGKGLRFHW